MIHKAARLLCCTLALIFCTNAELSKVHTKWGSQGAARNAAIWIGDEADARAELRAVAGGRTSRNIKRIVNLNDMQVTLPGDLPAGIQEEITEVTAVLNDPAKEEFISAFIEEGLDQGESVLIYDGERGCAKAGTVAIAYVMRHTGSNFNSAFPQLMGARPCMTKIVEDNDLMSGLMRLDGKLQGERNGQAHNEL